MSKNRTVNPIRHLAPAMVLVALLFGCDDAAPPQQAAPPPAPPVVFVTRAELRPVSLGAEFIGRVEAAERVNVRARVTGFLNERAFTEGQDVKAGDLLFRIEPQPFEAEVAGRQAQLEGAQAALANAALQVARGQELARTSALPRATLDQRVADQQVAAAQVSTARAALQQARIQLDYTAIRSPIAGRVGRASVTPGNVVGPDSGVLTTVVRDNVVRVLFPVTQRQLLNLKKWTAEHGDTPLLIRLRLPDGTQYRNPGTITFVNVTSDASTDSILVQADVPNPEGFLTDGQVIGVRVEETQGHDVLVIPESAVQMDQTGTFVLVVGDENKVAQTRVHLGDTDAGRAVVLDGLSPGTLVITEGAQRVRPGGTVSPKPAPALPNIGPVKG